MSAGLLFLDSDEFNIQKGLKGDILCHQIPGFSLVLFYSTFCGHCQNLLPIFKKLPGTIGGCQFGVVNVSINKRCVEMSQRTVTPIKYVPYILFYINGKPFMNYKGPQEEEEIRRFVLEVANNVHKKQQFSSEKVKESQEDGLPAYSIGKPIQGNDKVCYLDFVKAYPGIPPTNNKFAMMG